MLGLEFRRIIILSVLLLLWVIVSLGCNNTSEVIIGPEIDSINTIINIEFFENLDNGLRNLELRCVTDSIFPCANFLIEYDLIITSNTLDLTFTRISDLTICLDPFGPATAIVSLDPLANISYDFPITVDRVTVPAQLILTDSTIEILNGDSTWTNIVRSILYRVPASII